MSGYCAASDVAILGKNLLGEQDIFNTSSSPNNSAIDTWISSGCAYIETNLQAKGYTTPIASTNVLFGMLKDCNAMFAVARAELSRTNVILGPGERSRGQVFQKMFEDCLKGVLSMDLTSVGVTKSSVRGTIYVGGISESDKDSRYSDTDKVRARFVKGQFDWEGTLKPKNSNDSDSDSE